MDRRQLLKASLATGGLMGLGGCATAPRGGAPVFRDPMLSLAPIRAATDRIFDIKVCLRPFRVLGPRLDVEQIGGAMVVHNYGHGGSGWSLAWGSANIAVQKAMSTSPARIAVIGCGIIGLTSAITAQRAGAQVTIYTRELLPKTRSVRANGSWTPSSRIALTQPAGPAFGALWEQMARYSWKTYRSYLGLAGNPVAFCDQYALSDTPFQPSVHQPDPAVLGSYETSGMPQQNYEFARYDDRIRDLTPRAEILPEGATPFPVKHVSRRSGMFFNFTELGQVLMREFYGAGGKVVIRQFHAPAELGELPEKVVINCPGYAARDMWKDKAMIPVRGQTGWLVPQPEVNYGLSYQGTSVLSKSDGIMVLRPPGPVQGEMNGVGDSNEIAIRSETESAVRVIEQLFARFPKATT